MNCEICSRRAAVMEAECPDCRTTMPQCAECYAAGEDPTCDACANGSDERTEREIIDDLRYGEAYDAWKGK